MTNERPQVEECCGSQQDGDHAVVTGVVKASKSVGDKKSGGGSSVGDIFVGQNIFELGVSICVGDAMRVWVAVVPFFKSSPILERIRGRVWKNG